MLVLNIMRNKYSVRAVYTGLFQLKEMGLEEMAQIGLDHCQIITSVEMINKALRYIIQYECNVPLSFDIVYYYSKSSSFI